MSVIRVNGLSKKFGDRTVFRDASLRVEAEDRLGLVGYNGTGKTTLFRLLLGQEKPDAGTVEVEAGIRLGYFSQFSSLDGSQSIQEILGSQFAGIHDMERELADIAHRLELTQEEEWTTLIDRQAHLFEEMDRLDGWDVDVRIDTVLSRLGFDDVLRHQPLLALSGGWKNRAALSKLLLENPDVLLLDEPTNYLDLEGIAWLEQWFVKFKGAIVVISHDRHFLDRVVKRVAEIENHHFFLYDGGYSTYVLKRRLRAKDINRQFLHEEELLLYEEEAVRERRTLSGKQLGRRLADLKKRQEPRPVDHIFTSMYDSLNVPDSSLQVQDLSKGYGDRPLFQNLTLELRAGERLLVLGPNGCGKSTLLRVLTGEEKPDTGFAKWPGKGFSSFTSVWEEMDREDTVVHLVNIAPLAYRSQRKLVGRFLEMLQFSEKDQMQKVGLLSGGQQARVALALCLLSGAHTVVLDEPTNHLDLPSIQVMEQALYHFPGAVLAVSHDRFFVEKMATRMLIFKPDGSLSSSMDDWDALED
jgi:ATP-binding cassette, subfamily F, member 3